jgi:hypothetical protein
VSKFNSLSACLAFACAVSIAGDALAFCRTTTCNPEVDVCAFDDHGCNTEGVPVYWEGGATTLDVSAAGSPLWGISGEDLEAATSAAIATWQNVTCAGGDKPAIQVAAPELVPHPVPDFDEDGPNDNVVVFVDDAWAHEANAIAKTSLGFYLRSGILLDADIELNSDLFAFTVSGESGSADLQAVLTHEIGHVLGLDHSDVPGATMAPQANSSATEGLRTLHPDDIDAICSVYPHSEPPPGDDDGCTLARGSRSGSSAWSSWLVVLGAAWRWRSSRAAKRPVHSRKHPHPTCSMQVE